jgi:hypothetical protein
MTQRREVVVITTTPDASTTGGIKLINWNDSSDRKWLMNHLHWAMTNGRQVQLAPTDGESI